MYKGYCKLDEMGISKYQTPSDSCSLVMEKFASFCENKCSNIFIYISSLATEEIPCSQRCKFSSLFL